MPTAATTGAVTTFDATPMTATVGALAYLQNMNHNPLDLGDNLPTATNPANITNGTGTQLNQTWWGFPTWRETLSPLWNDPTVQVNVGLDPTLATARSASAERARAARRPPK